MLVPEPHLDEDALKGRQCSNPEQDVHKVQSMENLGGEAIGTRTEGS